MAQLPAPGGMPPRPPVVSPPPGASPAGPVPQEGLRAQARVKLSSAVKLLIEALAGLKEVGSEEGKAVLAALKALAPVTPEVGEGMRQSELSSLVAGASAVRPGGAGAGQPGMGGQLPPRPMVMGGPPGLR